MTGNTQKGEPKNDFKARQADLSVREMEGGKFRVKPLRRIGGNKNTMRAKLVCKSSLGESYHQF